MTDTPAPSRISAKDIVALACPIIAAVFVVSGPIWGGGQRDQRLQMAETRISQLEQRDERRSDLLNKIDVRTARIEATLQMMTKASVQ